jgi:hypothetical protein
MINVGAGVPFTPQARRGQDDAEWMHGYRERLAARRAGPVMAAEVTGQGAELARSWRAHGDRHERRRIGAYRVNRLLADAGLDNDVRAYQRSRTETLGLISRLQQRADPYAGYASRGSAAERRQVAEVTRSTGHDDDCTVCRSYREITR